MGDLPEGFRLIPKFLGVSEANHLQMEILSGVDWRQDHVTLFGRQHRIPRLHQWYADEGCTYCWSGLVMRPRPWLAPLITGRERLHGLLNETFNSVLVNLYRDGHDSMGWHADDEPELGAAPVIASVSLGASRELRLRQADDHARTVTVRLDNGSLLVMRGNSQRDWQHSLPKRKKVLEPRINLTFRAIVPSDQC